MNDKVNYRTCVCCRAMKCKYDMVRISVSDNKTICDTTFKAGGRGFYICSEECLDKILTSKKFVKVYNMISDESVLNEIKGVLAGVDKS